MPPLARPKAPPAQHSPPVAAGREDEDAESVDGAQGGPTADAERARDERERSHDERVDNDEQPFLAHLLELRRRLLRSFVAVLIIFPVVFYFSNEIFDFVSDPLRAQLPGDMIATQVATPFLTPFRLSVYATIFLAIPFLLHQAWGFVSPGLYLREKRFAVPLLASSVVLFYLGMAFAYFVVFPLAFRFFALIGAGLADVTMMTDINHYLDFVLKMFFAFGVAFEIPVATVLLAMTGLASASGMARKRPYVIVGCFVVGMLLTPPDVISQVLLALPAWLLFETGVLLARLMEKRDAAAAAVSGG